MHSFALSTIEPDGITNGKYYWVHLLCWKMGQEDFKYLTKSYYKWMFMCKPLSHSTFTKYSLSTQSLNSSNSSTTQTILALPSKCSKGVKPPNITQPAMGGTKKHFLDNLFSWLKSTSLT